MSSLLLKSDLVVALDPDDRILKEGYILVENDTLFIVGAVRGWRTGALFASDGAPGQIKPEWGEADFRRGEMDAINIALQAMWKLARADQEK